MAKIKSKLTLNAAKSPEKVTPLKTKKSKTVEKPEVKDFFSKVVESAPAKREVEVTMNDSAAIIEKPDGDWRNNLGKKITIAITGVFVLSLIAATGYFYYQWRQTKTNPQGVAKDALSDIVAEVGKLIELPVGEEPTMATVTSVEKLKDQPFFAKAQNGDRALIFSQSGKAILYRPSANKIIEVISLVGGGQSGSSQIPQPPVTAAEAVQAPAEKQPQAAEVAKTVNVAIYNGTTQKGLAKNLAAKITEIAEANVVKTGNAQGNFEKTIVIDLSGGNPDLAQKIAQIVGGEVGSLPGGEAKPEADILIIGGSNFKM